MYRPVPCFVSSVHPTHIRLSDSPIPSTLKTTLANSSEEELAGMLVQWSQRWGFWAAWFSSYPAATHSGFLPLMEKNLVLEKEVDGGWTYELTEAAVKMIHVRQEEVLNLERAIARQKMLQRFPVLGRIIELFRSPKHN